MKRKKWSELEEQTLLSKYAELLNSGTLAKLKTREKKFKPIADHVNAIHHLQDPINYPFRWSWRDVSIKVQNMRHQYLGVKQKIKVCDGEFNWDDGENHWENFLKYKEVFGDVELEVKEKRATGDLGVEFFGGSGDDGYGLGLGFDLECEDFEEDGDVGEEEEEEEEEEDEDELEEGCGDLGGGDKEKNENDTLGSQGKRLKKRRISLLGAKVLELRDMLVKREDRGRDREFAREQGLLLKEDDAMIDLENVKETSLRDAEDRLDNRELELEEMQMRWARLEFHRKLRLQRELDEERRLKIKLEEKRQEDEMEWRERMLGLQIHHEKQIMQMHADACQNHIQVLGIMARLMSQYFGAATDGLAAGLGGLPPQVLHNMQHPGPQDLGHDNKPDSNSPSEYM